MFQRRPVQSWGLTMFKTAKATQVASIDVTFFGASVEAFGRNYCVYEVWRASDNLLLYIGTCKFTSFPQMVDAQNNSMFMQMVGREETINVRLIATGTRTDCYNHRARLARGLPELPPCNKFGTVGRFSGILCEDDGATYRNQAECAAAYGISQGNLSAHLRGRPGYNKVGGRTFRKVAL